MRIFVIYPILAAFIFVSSTNIEISSAPVALPDPESLINNIWCAIFDVYESAIVALHKYSSEAQEAPRENEISSGMHSMLDVVRPDVNVVFGNFNAAIKKLSDTMNEASNPGQAELQTGQVVWNELKYGVRSLKRNILLIRANTNKSLDEIRKNFDNGSEQFSRAMNDLYTKVSNKLSFEVRSAINMFQHALSLPSLKYYDIDLENIYQNWTQFLQLATETPISLSKSAKNLINLIYNNIQSKFVLSGVLSDNSLWPLASIVWGDAVQVKRFVDNSLRHLERYIKTSLAQVRTKFGKGSVALLETNQSLYNQIFSEVKQLIDLTEIPFKRIFNFINEPLPFSTVCLTNQTYDGRFEELLKYLQERGYPAQIGLVQCINLVSSNTARLQAENFFDYMLEDTFKNLPASEVFSPYTNILQEERIKEVTDIYQRLFDVVQKCAQTAHEDGYKLPELISMKIEDDANKYTLLMNDIRMYMCKSAHLIEEYYSLPSNNYQNAINGLCEDIKYKLDIAADYTLSSIKRLNNYLENHASCFEKFPLWSNSGLKNTATLTLDGSEDKNIIVSENFDANDVRAVDVLTSVSEVDNVENVGIRDMKSSNLELKNDILDNDGLKIISGTLEREATTLQVDATKTEAQCDNSEEAHTAITTLKLNQDMKMDKEQEISLLLDNIMPKSGVEDLTTIAERRGIVSEDGTAQIVKSSKTDSIDRIDITDLRTSNVEFQTYDLVDNSRRTTEASNKYKSHQTIENFDCNSMPSKEEDNIKFNNFKEVNLVAEDQDVKPDKVSEDVLLINKIVSTEITADTSSITKDDTTITGNQLMYGSTIHTDVSLEENQPNNLGTLISSDKESSVLDNIVSSEEVEIDKSACNEDIKLNEQGTDSLLTFNRGNEEPNIGTIGSDVIMKRCNQISTSTSTVDTDTQKLAETEIIASRENAAINIDTSAKSNQLIEISNDSLVVDRTEQVNNESHILSKDAALNFDMSEQEVETMSNFNVNLLRRTNEFGSNAEISQQKPRKILREIDIPLNRDRCSKETSNIKSETSQDTNTLLKIDSIVTKNGAKCDQEQIFIDSNEKVIPSKTIIDEMSSAIKIEESSIANTVMDSELIINDNKCSTKSHITSGEQNTEMSTTRNAMVNHITMEKTLTSSSNNDLNVRLNSDSKMNIENSMESTEVRNNDWDIIQKNNEKIVGTSCLTVNDDTVNKKITSAYSNTLLLNEECAEENSSTVENLKVIHNLVSHESIRNIDEVITADGDRSMKINSIPRNIIEMENNGENSFDELTQKISIVNASSVNMKSNEIVTDEDSIIDYAGRQVESNEIDQNDGKIKLENIEEIIEDIAEVGSCTENEAKKVTVNSKTFCDNENLVEKMITSDKIIANFEDSTLNDIQIPKKTIESDIQDKSTSTCADENLEYRTVIKKSAKTTKLMMDAINKQDEESLLEDQPIVTSLNNNQIGNTLKADSIENTIEENLNSMTMASTISCSTLIDSKENLTETDIIKENDRSEATKKGQNRILAEFDEEMKLKNTSENEMISIIKDKETNKLYTSKSSAVTKSELSVNEEAFNRKIQSSETNDIVSNELTSRKNSETQLENISTKNTAEQETLLNEFLTSEDATTIVEKAIVRNEINKQETDVLFENSSLGSQPESIISTSYAIPAAKESLSSEKVENNENDYSKIEPFYHIAWFPKKSQIPIVSPLDVNPSNDENYGWVGWLLPGKRPPLDFNSENCSTDTLGRVYDSGTKFLTSTSDKQLETSNKKNVEIEQISGTSSLTSEIIQSSFTETNSIDDINTDMEVLKIPISKVNVIND